MNLIRVIIGWLKYKRPTPRIKLSAIYAKWNVSSLGNIKTCNIHYDISNTTMLAIK